MSEFPGLLSDFFSLIESEISEKASQQVATEEPDKGCENVKGRN